MNTTIIRALIAGPWLLIPALLTRYIVMWQALESKLGVTLALTLNPAPLYALGAGLLMAMVLSVSTALLLNSIHARHRAWFLVAYYACALFVFTVLWSFVGSRGALAILVQ
jgi:hypothetical protein